MIVKVNRPTSRGRNPVPTYTIYYDDNDREYQKSESVILLAKSSSAIAILAEQERDDKEKEAMEKEMDLAEEAVAITDESGEQNGENDDSANVSRVSPAVPRRRNIHYATFMLNLEIKSKEVLSRDIGTSSPTDFSPCDKENNRLTNGSNKGDLRAQVFVKDVVLSAKDIAGKKNEVKLKLIGHGWTIGREPSAITRSVIYDFGIRAFKTVDRIEQEVFFCCCTSLCSTRSNTGAASKGFVLFKYVRD